MPDSQHITIAAAALRALARLRRLNPPAPEVEAAQRAFEADPSELNWERLRASCLSAQLDRVLETPMCRPPAGLRLDTVGDLVRWLRPDPIVSNLFRVDFRTLTAKGEQLDEQA